MKNMRILVDCDGVLCDFQGAYLRTLGELHGIHKTHADVTDFSFSKCVATKEQDDSVWRHIDATKGFVEELDWHPGAEEGLARLFQLGHVVCVTSPHHGPTWMPERHKWLRDRGFARRDIVFASDKSFVCGDVFIDDKAEHCEEWAKEHRFGVSILLDAPYNRIATATTPNVHRAFGWEQIVGIVTARKSAWACAGEVT